MTDSTEAAFGRSIGRPAAQGDLSSVDAAVQFAPSGLPRRFDVHGLSMLTYPAGRLEDGLTCLYLRVPRTDGSLDVRPLVGLRSGGTLQPDPSGPTVITQHPGGLQARVSFRLAQETSGWFWHVALTRAASVSGDPVVCDVIAIQDPALAAYGAVRSNEYYVSQYLDITGVPVPDHGTAVAVRQNMPGARQPWALLGCLGVADRWASDALQLTGRGRLDGEELPGLTADLPARRLQHEHALVGLQTETFVLDPGGSFVTGFFGIVVPDHPAATSDADSCWATSILTDPAAAPPTTEPDGAGLPIARSLFGAAPTLRCRELESGVPAASASATDPPAVTVTSAEQRVVLRPHGHLMRTGSALVPDERTVTCTSWMAGTFASQLTQGHAGRGAILSLRRSYLGLFAAHGLRIFVAPTQTPGVGTSTDPGAYRLLAVPSCWTQRLDGCTWEYLPTQDEVDGGLPSRIVVEVTAPADAHLFSLTVTADSAVALLVSAHFVGDGDDGAAPGSVATEADSAGATVTVGTGTVRMEWPDRSVSRVSGCEALTADRSGGTAGTDDELPATDDPDAAPYVVLTIPAATSWALTLIPDLLPADELTVPSEDPTGLADPSGTGPPGVLGDPADPVFWQRISSMVQMAPSAGTAQAAELERIAAILPWFSHDALIHYLSPRGLEQFTGGAWGTRDVCQGPVGLLLAAGAHTALREVCRLLLQAQHSRGDWPQAFEFYPRYVEQQVSDAHGDVVYWPLLAIGEYLAATGDESLLLDLFPFVGAGSAATPDHGVAHLESALDFIEGTLIAGTALPAYGHGDWNDSLQPADPGLAAALCSTWTVVLQAHALTTLADALQAIPAIGARTAEVARRARAIADAGTAQALEVLQADGVLAGYGYFPTDRDDPRRPTELLVHPDDSRTGLRFSVLPMIHAISGALLTAEQAAAHLSLIADHLIGPDGVRLFDAPVGYHGGPMEVFQRAEAATFFGREIGIMYTHAHLRYAEALAVVGDAAGLLQALALANPIGITERVRSARPRQQTTYYSSSDGVFDDRYAAKAGYPALLEGRIPLEGGWRVYSSGPGIYLRLVTERLLGIRQFAGRIVIDPVLDPAVGTVTATLPVAGRPVTVVYTPGESGCGVREVRAGNTILTGSPEQNPYRPAGLSIDIAVLQVALRDAGDRLEVILG